MLTRTETPWYILKAAPVVDTCNWLLNPVLYCLAPACECIGGDGTYWASVLLLMSDECQGLGDFEEGDGIG